MHIACLSPLKHLAVTRLTNKRFKMMWVLYLKVYRLQPPRTVFLVNFGLKTVRQNDFQIKNCMLKILCMKFNNRLIISISRIFCSILGHLKKIPLDLFGPLKTPLNFYKRNEQNMSMTNEDYYRFDLVRISHGLVQTYCGLLWSVMAFLW